MSGERTRTPPPRLERVPTGYTPPPIRHGLTPTPLPGSALQAVAVTAEAAIRAGVPQRGDLVRDSALHLFHLAGARRASGRLRIRTDGDELDITFRSGIPDRVRSRNPADGLLRFLLEREAVEPGAVAELAGDDADQALASWVVAQRGAEAVSRLVKEHGVRLTTRALQAERGEWEWEPHAPARSLAAPLGSPFSLLAQAVRAMDPETVRRRLGPRAQRRAALVRGAFGVEELALSPEELAAALRFDGGASPEAIAATSATGAGAVLRTALLLFETGLLATAG